MNDPVEAADIIRWLDLTPLAGEGGHWAQTWIDSRGTAIYFLTQPEHFSAFHRLPTVEQWYYHGGAPAEHWQLHPDGTATSQRLGLDLAAGERPQLTAAAGSWQGARTLGAWTLLGCSMAPPFDGTRFELARRDDLVAAYPAQAAEIEVLTRHDETAGPAGR